MTIACSWCTAPMEAPENTPKESSGMCPACKAFILEKMHAEDEQDQRRAA